MVDRMKDPRCLIDAEALASHVSIVSLSETNQPGEETGTKKRRKKGDGSTSRKEENSS